MTDACVVHLPLFSILLFPHIYARAFNQTDAAERASTVLALRMSRPRHFSVSISSNNSPLIRQKIPKGRKGRVGRRREGREGWLDVNSGGDGGEGSATVTQFMQGKQRHTLSRDLHKLSFRYSRLKPKIQRIRDEKMRQINLLPPSIR